MTGGEAYKQKLLTDDALDAAISAREDVTAPQRRHAVKTAVLLAPVA